MVCKSTGCSYIPNVQKQIYTYKDAYTDIVYDARGKMRQAQFVPLIMLTEVNSTN